MRCTLVKRYGEERGLVKRGEVDFACVRLGEICLTKERRDWAGLSGNELLRIIEID